MLRKLFEYLAASIAIGIALMLLLGGVDPALAAPEPSVPSPYMLDASTTAQIVCRHSSGTAIHLGGGQYATVAHVVHGDRDCAIGDKPIVIDHINILADWALIHSEASLPFHVVWSCDRLARGQVYFATGYAEGNSWPVTTRLIGDGYREENSAYARGSIIDGMSGGAVSDIDGVVHAINESRGPDGIPAGGVVELADTPLCKK